LKGNLKKHKEDKIIREMKIIIIIVMIRMLIGKEEEKKKQISTSHSTRVGDLDNNIKKW